MKNHIWRNFIGISSRKFQFQRLQVVGFIRPAQGLYGLYASLRGPSECFLTPKICPNENITYHLYTNSNATAPVRLSVDDPDSIRNAEFVQGPIKLLIHGYAGHKDYTPNMEIRPEYLKRPENINVISVDYGPIAAWGCYIEAGKNLVVVANCTAQFLEHLLKIRQDIQLSQIHIVAYSLGAHIAGQITHYFSMGRLERITGSVLLMARQPGLLGINAVIGLAREQLPKSRENDLLSRCPMIGFVFTAALDAALPMFLWVWESKELRTGNAKFIDALHTNGGMKGKLLPFADVDFYANGGCFQPPCSMTNTSCHHAFACELFAESINKSPDKFRARRFSFKDFFLEDDESDDDSQWEVFGEYVNPGARGTYSFKTRDIAPYALSTDESDT